MSKIRWAATKNKIHSPAKTSSVQITLRTLPKDMLVYPKTEKDKSPQKQGEIQV